MSTTESGLRSWAKFAATVTARAEFPAHRLQNDIAFNCISAHLLRNNKTEIGVRDNYRAIENFFITNAAEDLLKHRKLIRPGERIVWAYSPVRQATGVCQPRRT